MTGISGSLPASIPQVLINREPLPHQTFDIELLGDCDVIVDELARRLDWSNGLSTTAPLRQIGLFSPLSCSPYPPPLCLSLPLSVSPSLSPSPPLSVSLSLSSYLFFPFPSPSLSLPFLSCLISLLSWCSDYSCSLSLPRGG